MHVSPCAPSSLQRARTVSGSWLEPHFASNERLSCTATARLRFAAQLSDHNHEPRSFEASCERTSGVIWLKTMWSLAAICDLVQRWASTLMFTIVCSSWI